MPPVDEEESSCGEVEGAARAVRIALAAIAAAAAELEITTTRTEQVLFLLRGRRSCSPRGRSLQCIIWCDIIARLGRSRRRREGEKCDLQT